MTKRRFWVDRAEIHYLRSTLESYDGMAVVSTMESAGALIEVQIAPGCEELAAEVLKYLQSTERLFINEVL